MLRLRAQFAPGHPVKATVDAGNWDHAIAPHRVQTSIPLGRGVQVGGVGSVLPQRAVALATVRLSGTHRLESSGLGRSSNVQQNVLTFLVGI